MVILTLPHLEWCLVRFAGPGFLPARLLSPACLPGAGGWTKVWHCRVTPTSSSERRGLGPAGPVHLL